MFKKSLLLLALLVAPAAFAQTCVPINGITCSPNLNLNLAPFNYKLWNVPTNANWLAIDALSLTLPRLNVANTFTFPITAPSFNGDLNGNATTATSATTAATATHAFNLPADFASQSGFGVTTSPVCPNGPGGQLTTSGCAGGASGGVSGQAVGVFGLPTGPTVIGAQSHLDDGVTTPSTITSTEDVVLPSSSNTATGLQVPTANAAVTQLSVLAFGAKGDMKATATNTCSVANTSATLTCPSGTFTSSAVNVGQSVVIFPNTGSCPIPGTLQASGVTLCTALISTFTDSAHVVLNQTATASKPATVRFGTDSTAAFDACEAAGSALGGGTCKVPGGAYLLASAPYYMYWGAHDTGDFEQSAGGSGAVITANMGSGPTAGQIASYTVSNGGSGYTPNSQLQLNINATTFTNVSAGCGTNPQTGVAAVLSRGPCGWAYGLANTDASGHVVSVTNTYPGYGMVSAPPITVVPLGGDGATLTANMTAGVSPIASVTVNTGGGGYAASVSNIPVYGINGTGCTPIASQTANINAPGVNITAIGLASTNSSGAITSVSMSNASSGCTGAPTLIIGNNTCWSGSDFTAQCVNVAPLVPIKTPVQIGMFPYVNWEGSASVSSKYSEASNIWSVWDGITTDNNQPIVFGGTFYITYKSINSLAIQGQFIGIASTFSISQSSISNMLFAGGNGAMFGSTDLGSDLTNWVCYGSSCLDVGGQWGTRVDRPGIEGGNTNSELVSNIVDQAFAYQLNPTAANIDTWFDNNFYHTDFSSHATDYVETCAFPLTPNPRQTSHGISQPGGNGGGNNLCYPGLTNWGIIELQKQNNGSSGHNISNVQVKYAARGCYYGYFGAAVFDGCGFGEGSTAIVTDPYRHAAIPEATFIYNAAARGVAKNIGGGFAIGAVTQAIYSPAGIPGASLPAGYPQGSWQNITCGGTCSTPSYLLTDNYPTSSFSGVNLGQPGFVGVGGMSITATSLGAAFKPASGTDMLDLHNGGIILNGGSYLNSNQGTGLKLQHSTGTGASQPAFFNAAGDTVSTVPAGRTGTVTCTSGGTIAVSNTNFTAASVVYFGIKTVGGTPGPLAQTTPVPATGFSVICATGDTSVYNYFIPF